MDIERELKEKMLELDDWKGRFTASDIILDAFVGFLSKTEDGKVELAKKEIVKVFDINNSRKRGRLI